MKKQQDKGFTLVEMLVVIVIIGVLASVLLTTIGSMRENGHATKCKANLKNLAQGVINKTGNEGYMMFASSFVFERYGVWHPRQGWVSWLRSDNGTINYARPPGNQAHAYFWKPEAPSGLTQPTCYAGNNGQNGRKSIEEGELWEYVNKDISIYLCPKHKREKVGNAPICRSYAMNGYFFYSNVHNGTGISEGNDGRPSDPPRKLTELEEGMRMMLFAEMGLNFVKQTGRNTAAIVPWKNDEINTVFNNNKSGLQNFLSGNEPAPTAEKTLDPIKGSSSEGRDSMGFNHKRAGKQYGMAVFLDGHVKELPKRYEGLDPKNNNTVVVNPTFRTALGLY